MKKILYLVDCSLKQCHSVRDILYSLLKHNDIQKYENILVNCYSGTSRIYYVSNMIEGYKTYTVPEINIKEKFLKRLKNKSSFGKITLLIDRLLRKVPRVSYIYREWDRMRYLEKIITQEKPDMIVILLISPIKDFSKLCMKMKIPYIYMLYDTYIERPGLEKKDIIIEDEEIKNSLGYFVPDFFVEAYRDYYPYQNIYSYCLPLLIPKECVIKAYDNTNIRYEFTYFGQMQSFRNGARVKEFFSQLGYKLDIFSMEKKESDKVFLYHQAVSAEKLYETVASSRFLVAFDNGEPFSHYLPSKAYLYVSFTKPIIVFGNNKDSALKRFLNDYPFFLYFNTEESSLDELLLFIKNIGDVGFDEKVYSMYMDYLPQNALKGITDTINNAIE